MFTKQECKKAIYKKLEEKQIVTRRELINTGRRYVGDNLRYFVSVDTAVNASLRELVSTGIITRTEREQYKKFMKHGKKW